MWKQAQQSELQLVLVTEAGVPKKQLQESLSKGTVRLWQAEREVTKAFGVAATPAALVISADGTRRTNAARGVEAIDLVLNAVGQYQQNGPLDRASTIPLVDSKGLDFSLKSFYGKRLLVVFWNPTCGFCQQMESDLVALDRTVSSPVYDDLLVVVSGDSDAKMSALSCRIAIDPEFKLGTTLGAQGTPAAALFAADGVLVGGVIHGAAQIMALAASPAR
jgi:thiol-disulfide isomerase/thioredoxin